MYTNCNTFFCLETNFSALEKGLATKVSDRREMEKQLWKAGLNPQKFKIFILKKERKENEKKNFYSFSCCNAR